MITLQTEAYTILLHIHLFMEWLVPEPCYQNREEGTMCGPYWCNNRNHSNSNECYSERHYDYECKPELVCERSYTEGNIDNCGICRKSTQSLFV